MTPESEIYAGFYDTNDIEEMEDEMEKSMWLKKHLVMALPLTVFVVALLLGKLISIQSDVNVKEMRKALNFCFTTRKEFLEKLLETSTDAQFHLTSCINFHRCQLDFQTI